MSKRPIKIKQWIKQLSVLDYSKSDSEKFRDFCELSYCAFAKLTALSPEAADKLEERYMRIVETYRDKETIHAYPELLSEAINFVKTHENEDFLGTIAAELNVLSSRQGQFFTPMEVSELIAGILSPDIGMFIEKQGYITLSEPAAGAGGMVLAFAERMRRKGYDPKINLLVQAVDLNPLAYQMCYLQLTWAGIPAAVIRGNTLSLETFESAWTLAAITQFYPHHGHLSFETNEPRQTQYIPRTHQPSLFDFEAIGD